MKSTLPGRGPVTGSAEAPGGTRTMIDTITDALADQFQRAPYDDAPVAMAVLSTDDFRIVAANHTADELAGVARGELLGLPLAECVDAPTFAAATALLGQFGAGSGIVRARQQVSLRDGPPCDLVVWLMPCGRAPEHAVLVLVLPWAEPLAVESVETVDLERVAPLPGAMALVTDARWQVRSVCPQMASALGYTMEQLCGVAIADLVHPEDIGFLVAAAARADGGAGPCSALDVRFRAASGRWLAFASSAAPLRGASGFDGLAITAFTHSQLHASITRVAKLAGEIQHVLEAAANTRDAPRAVGPGPMHYLLSAREREIVDMVAAGLRVSTIADRLYIAPGTVRNHLSAIFRKLGVSSQAELAELLQRSAPS